MKKEKLKIIYMGTPDFAVPVLVSLIHDKRFDVVAVVTQEDKKIGRKQELVMPAVKQVALKHGIDVVQPKCLECISAGIMALEPDMIVVAAFGKILKKEILDIPKYGCINIHASLLPKYRGASCIQASLLNNDSETGISIMKMDEGLDTGDVIYQQSLAIDKNDNAGTLFDKLSKLSSEVIGDVLVDYSVGKLKTKRQDNSKSSYVGLIKKSDGKVNLDNSVNNIIAQYKAMTPWPGIFIKQNGATIKLIELSDKIIKQSDCKGLKLFDDKIYLQVSDGAILVNRLQLAGKKAMNSSDFIKGNSKHLK